MIRRLFLPILPLLFVALLATAFVARRQHPAGLSAGPSYGDGLPAPATGPRDVTPRAPDGVAGLDGLTPALRRSVSRAIEAARADGVALRVTSGWRSAEHQQRLYADAIRKYGSPERARQWVLPPEESAHVLGQAVDVGPPDAANWLDRNGERFGLCRRYANEPWHFERLAGAKGSKCPPLEPHA